MLVDIGGLLKNLVWAVAHMLRSMDTTHHHHRTELTHYPRVPLQFCANLRAMVDSTKVANKNKRKASAALKKASKAARVADEELVEQQSSEGEEEEDNDSDGDAVEEEEEDCSEEEENSMGEE